MMRLIVLLFAVLLCVSCTTNMNHFPSGWPATAASLSCNNLSGEFANQGQASPANESSRLSFLSELLVPYMTAREHVEHRWVDVVRLSLLDEGRLEVIFYENNKPVFKQVMRPEDDYSCQRSKISIKRNYSKENLMGITEQFVTNEFVVTNDGSMIVSVGRVDVGLVFLIPYRTTEVDQYLFLEKRVTQ